MFAWRFVLLKVQTNGKPKAIMSTLQQSASVPDLHDDTPQDALTSCTVHGLSIPLSPELEQQNPTLSFGGTQSFSLRQLWPLKAYYFSLKRDAEPKIVYKNKARDAILELGVGSNMTSSVQYWAKAINVLDQNSHVTPFARKLFGYQPQLCSLPSSALADAGAEPSAQTVQTAQTAQTEQSQYLGLDPFLEKIESIWLFHYFMCSQPAKFTAAWFLFNQFNHQTFTKDLALEELKLFVKDQLNLGTIKQEISDNTLEKDLAVVIRSYSPLTHDVGVIRKQVKKLDNLEELTDTPLRELNLMSSSVHSTQFNLGSHANLSPYVVAFCLLDFFLRSQKRLVTMDFNKIAYAAGSVGKIFKLDELSLDAYLQQLDDVTQGSLIFTEQNGLRQLICTVPENERLALLERFLERIYNHG